MSWIFYRHGCPEWIPSSKKNYAIFYQDHYGREWGDAIFSGPNGEVEIASGVIILEEMVQSERHGYLILMNYFMLLVLFNYALSAIIERNFGVKMII